MNGKSLLARLFTPVKAAVNILNQPPPIEAAEVDAVVVMDCSPSMLEPDWPPTRLNAAQDAGWAFCQELHEQRANVAIIGFSYRIRHACALTPASATQVLHDAIYSITTGYGTNIHCGLNTALKIVRHSSAKKKHIILLTDGCHNALGCDPCVPARALRKIATVECVGIGQRERIDEELLRDHIASEYPDGSKRYRWIGDRTKLIQHFQSIATGLMR